MSGQRPTSKSLKVSNILKITKLPPGATTLDVEKSFGNWSSRIKHVDIVDGGTAIVRLHSVKDAAQIINTTSLLTVKHQQCPLTKIFRCDSGNEPLSIPQSSERSSFQLDSGHDYHGHKDYTEKWSVPHAAEDSVQTSPSVTTKSHQDRSRPEYSSLDSVLQRSVTDARSHGVVNPSRDSKSPDPHDDGIHKLAAHNVSQQQTVITPQDGHSFSGFNASQIYPGMEDTRCGQAIGFEPFMNVGSNIRADQSVVRTGTQSIGSAEPARFMNNTHYQQTALGTTPSQVMPFPEGQRQAMGTTNLPFPGIASNVSFSPGPMSGTGHHIPPPGFPQINRGSIMSDGVRGNPQQFEHMRNPPTASSQSHPVVGDPAMSELSKPRIVKKITGKCITDSDSRLLRSTMEPFDIDRIFIDNYEGVLYYIFKDQKGTQKFLASTKSTTVSEATLTDLESYHLDRLLITGCRLEDKGIFDMFVAKAFLLGLSLTRKQQGSNTKLAVFLLKEGFGSVFDMATFIEGCLDLAQHHFVVAPVKKTNVLKVKFYKSPAPTEFQLSKDINRALKRQAIEEIRKSDHENAFIVETDSESSFIESELKDLIADNKYEVEVYYPCLYEKTERLCICSGTSDKQTHSHGFSMASSSSGIFDSHSPQQDSQNAKKSQEQNQPEFKVKDKYDKRELIVLEKCALIQELEKAYPDVKIEIDTENGTVTVWAGDKDHGEVVQLKLEKHVREKFFQLNFTNFTPEQMEVIKCEGFLNKLRKDFNDVHKIPACIDISGDRVNITYEKGTYDEAEVEEIVTSAVTVEEIPLQPLEIVMYQSEQWKSKVMSMGKNNSEFKFCRCQVKESKLVVIGPPAVQYKIKEVMKKFSASAVSENREVEFSDMAHNFATTHLRKELQFIEGNVNRLGANMYWDENICHLEGLKDGVDRGQHELMQLRSKIKVTSKELAYPCAEEYLWSEAGAEEIRKTEKKHSCIITVGSNSDDSDMEEEKSDHHRVNLQSRHCLGTLIVSTIEDDLSKARADVVVNTVIKQDTTNAVRIVTSDLDLDEDTRTALEETVRVEGEVVKTDVRKGMCNKEVSHLFFSSSINSGDLWKHIKKVVTDIDEKGKCESIALSLEMKALAFLKKQDANDCRTLVKTLVDELKSCTNIRTLSLHAVNDESISSAQKYLLEITPTKSKSSKVTAGATFSSMAYAPTTTKQKNVSAPHQKKPFGPISVAIKEGDITKAKTDVIVSSADPSLDMTKGMVIKTVRKDGGPQIEQELKQRYPNGIQTGEFAQANGGNLRCKRLFLCCIPSWNKNTSPSQIQSIVVKMLKEANSQKFTSISFPAFGTGNLNYDPAITCGSVLRGVEEFARDTSQIFTKNVKLVVFHTDATVLQAYKATLAAQLTLSTGTISKSSDAFDFGNITVKVTPGDIISQKTNAIVISIDGSLDLSKGIVAKLVLHHGGQTIQDQLKQQYPTGLRDYEMGYTTGGNLHCDHLFHAIIPHWKSHDKKKMVKLLENILKAADEKKAQSVSLPAFGTGNLAYPPEMTTEFTLQSISNFSKTKPKSLRTVELVVRPSDTNVKKAFHEGLDRAATAQSNTQSEDVQKTNKGFFSTIVSAIVSVFGGSPTTKADAVDAYHVDFNSVRMFIKHGDIADESCHALVLGMRDDRNIPRSGAVCAHIARCYPPLGKLRNEYVDDLYEYGLTYIRVRGTSKLHCEGIFCLSIEFYQNDWSQGVENVLKKAERERIESIALPLLGANTPGVDLSDATRTIVDGVRKFSLSKPKFVNDVRIVIYEKHLFQELLDNSQASVLPMPRQSSVGKSCNTAATSDAHIIKHDVSEKAVVHFCHEFRKDIGNVINEFFEHCISKHKTSEHKSGNVKEFSLEQIKALVEKGRKHCYKVQVFTESGKVRMSGFGDVSKVHNKISEIEAEVEKRKKQHLADSMNTEMRWEYKWGGEYKDFSNVANCELEADFKSGKTESYVEIDDDIYVVNLTTMKARNTDNGDLLEVNRRNRWESGEPLPPHWDRMDDSQEVKIIDLDAQSQEYRDVEQHFKNNGAKGTIQTIQRVQNRALYQQYTAKKREIEGRNPPGHENELLLFHGSDCNAVDAINRTGFNRSYCGKNATVFGLGVYFAESAAYSELYAKPDDKNERRLYQARVLVGNAIESNSSMRYLPMQPGMNVPYDSGKAPPFRKEGIHIIFHDSQAYPEFLITFTLPANTPKA